MLQTPTPMRAPGSSANVAFFIQSSHCIFQYTISFFTIPHPITSLQPSSITPSSFHPFNPFFTHRSHADNNSVQRSAITAATAGSDAGVWLVAVFLFPIFSVFNSITFKSSLHHPSIPPSIHSLPLHHPSSFLISSSSTISFSSTIPPPSSSPLLPPPSPPPFPPRRGGQSSLLQ